MRKKQKEKIANRLASISNKAPKVTEAKIPTLKSKEELRRSPREPVFRPGKLFLSKTEHLRCIIRNISATGAYLHTEGVQPLPEVVVLHFDQTGVVKKARVVWQNEIEVGLDFI